MNSLGTKVALVDDSPVFRNGLKEILELWGYKVILTAINGKDLLRQLTTANTPDICITDINMPVMNGYETIAVLKEKWPGIKTVAFSITNNTCEETRALQAGAQAFVSKTDSIVELQKVLHDI